MRKDHRAQSDRRVPLASAGKLVQQVRKVPSDRRGRKVKRVRRGRLARPVSAAKLDPKVPLVLQDQSDHRAPKATPARPRPSVPLPERTR